VNLAAGAHCGHVLHVSKAHIMRVMAWAVSAACGGFHASCGTHYEVV
jgi:hypothetical protein